MVPTISLNTPYGNTMHSDIVAYSADSSVLTIEDSQNNSNTISLVLETANAHIGKRVHIPSQNNNEGSCYILLIPNDEKNGIIPIEKDPFEALVPRETDTAFIIKKQRTFSKRTGLRNGKFAIDDAFDKLFDKLDVEVVRDFS